MKPAERDVLKFHKHGLDFALDLRADEYIIMSRLSSSRRLAYNRTHPLPASPKWPFLLLRDLGIICLACLLKEFQTNEKRRTTSPDLCLETLWIS